jgi:hypothetical protein
MTGPATMPAADGEFADGAVVAGGRMVSARASGHPAWMRPAGQQDAQASGYGRSP